MFMNKASRIQARPPRPPPRTRRRCLRHPPLGAPLLLPPSYFRFRLVMHQSTIPNLSPR